MQVEADALRLDNVKQGGLIGVLHSMESLTAQPIEIRAPTASIVYAILSGGVCRGHEGLFYFARPVVAVGG
ncbi:hypothetical protein MesoLj131c_68350 (plasmid) [Mesorhizobium sp. 131-3-5]|nr:hypothetical protein MesoLj131c_68350 [Mesorhizobium sp. 131-3-5]